MKRIISAISAILLLFSVSFACAEDEIDGYGVLGESYEMGKGSVKLVAYYVDQVVEIKGIPALAFFRHSHSVI